MSLVFVYGTLKSGKSNHHFMAGQRLLGTAFTEPVYRLYQLEGYPGMVEREGSGVSVEGEIWEVDAAAMVGLDGLEGIDEGLYVRVAARLLPPWHDREVETYLYRRSLDGRHDLGGRFEG